MKAMEIQEQDLVLYCTIKHTFGEQKLNAKETTR